MFLTKDCGDNWTKLPIPESSGPVRDIAPLTDDNVLILADEYIGIIQPTSSDAHTITNVSIDPKLLPSPQCICLADNDVYIGGFPGIYKAKLENLLAGQHSHKYFDWGKIIPLGNQPGQEVRSIAYDPTSQELFTGGWMSPNNTYNQVHWPGTGLYVSQEGRAFSQHPQYEQMKDPHGPVSINTISTFRHQGHQILMIGGEGRSFYTNQFEITDYPFLYIFVDGTMVEQTNVNNVGLAAAGGYDLVTPQKGIVYDELSSKVYVSIYSGNLVSTDVNAIIKGQMLEWKPITTPRRNINFFEAGHISIARTGMFSNRIAVAGEPWHSKQPIQLRIADSIHNPRNLSQPPL